MLNMFKQLFMTVQTFFAAAEKIGKAADNLATWAEEASGAFADEARMERQHKLAEAKAKRLKAAA